MWRNRNTERGKMTMRNIKCKGCANLKNEWCDKKNDSPDPELERDCPHYWELTNADHIRRMTDEELADLLDAFSSCSRCRKNGNDCFPVGDKLDWLQQPYKENEDDR